MAPSTPSSAGSLPDILDVTRIDGARADAAAPPDLLIEIPHGATRTEDFVALERLLQSPLPPSLIDFFHVNTDAGAPELAAAVARALVEAAPARSVAILRCRIPRTFIDCNRLIDAAPEDFKAGKVTPGLMPWITLATDRALLRARYDAYVSAVRAAGDRSLPTGALLLLHTYAPRSVEVEVDERIVESLHRAYTPEVEPTFTLRPEVDVIGRGTDGVSLAPPAVSEALREELRGIGITAADSATYPLHSSTVAWHHATRWPGRVLCVEVRRDLLADPFDPFVQMHIGAAKVARLAPPIARALRRWWD